MRMTTASPLWGIFRSGRAGKELWGAVAGPGLILPFSPNQGQLPPSRPLSCIPTSLLHRSMSLLKAMTARALSPGSWESSTCECHHGSM